MRQPQSTKDLEADAARESQEAEDNLTRYFKALDDKARAEFRILADRDRRFGEDVAAERAERGSSGNPGGSGGAS